MTLAEFRRVGLKVSSFLSAFGLAKGAAFIGPLLLSQLMSIDDYGAVEFGLSVGTIAAQLVSLGITGAIPQLMLVRKEDRVLDILFFQVLVTGGLAMLAAVIVGLSGWGWHGAFACVAVGGAGAQLASSVYFRAKGWRYAIMLADNLSLYIFILVGGAILLAFGAPDSRSISIGYGSVVLTILLASAAGFTTLVRPAFLKAYGEAISIGFFMMVNGVIYVGLANSARILVGTFMSLEDVSLYSICFRLSAAIILVHSMMVTAFFKKMYEGDPEWFDWFYVRCLSVMMAVAVLLLVAFDLFGGVIIPAWRDKIPHLTAVLPLTCVQAIWWVSMSQIALRLDRALITRQATGWLAGCVMLMVITLAVLDVAGLLTLVTASSVFAAILLLAIQIQLYLLRRAGVHLPQTRLAIWAPLLLAPVTLAFLG